MLRILLLVLCLAVILPWAVTGCNKAGYVTPKAGVKVKDLPPPSGGTAPAPPASTK